MRGPRYDWSSCVLVVVMTLGGTSLHAQVPSLVFPPAASAGALQRLQMDEELRRRKSEREFLPMQDAVVSPESKEVATPVSENGVRFELKEIHFTPSEILAPIELNAIAAEYLGKSASLDDLRQLLGRVNALYKAKGVVTAAASIGQQDVTDGVLAIKLVEGRIGKIAISGNSSTNRDFIIPRLGVASGDLVDLKRLEKNLDWFNRSSDARLQTSLAPGSAFGQTDLILDITEPRKHELSFSFDNMGSQLTGVWRKGLSYRNRSVLGWRDDFGLSYLQAPGQDSWALSYAVPVNRWGGRLSLGLYDDRTKILKGDLASLNISGKSQSQVLMWRQPLWMTTQTQLDLLVGAKWRESRNFVDKILLQNTESHDQSLGAEWLWSKDNKSLNLSAIRYWTTAKQVEREAAVVDRASLRYSQRFSNGLTFRSALSVQDSKSRNLNSGEQFFLGGEGNVRGYPVGSYSGDRGQTLNLEIHHFILNTQFTQLSLASSGFFFADYGRVAPFRPPQSLLPVHERLSGIGWGMNTSLGEHTSLRMTFARGLEKLPQENHSYAVTMQVTVSLL